MIFVQLDYSAGVLPVTHVSPVDDALNASSYFTSYPNIAPAFLPGYKQCYDAQEMAGLPVGVQVVGRRLEEERVLEGMKVVEVALKSVGSVFVPRKF
jgi:Asp-tRNA(Asn)/Glu-tRNA(Gln) amidotransferase A subunit family amidase